MIPAHIDVEALAGELATDNLTIDPAILKSYGEREADMVQHYRDILDGLAAPNITENLGETKIAVIPEGDFTSSDIRDVAQALKNETGANTVIVQSHGPAGVVSDTLSRSQIEQKQSLINRKVDPTAAETYINSLDGTDVDFTLVNGVVLTAVAVGVVATAAFARLPFLRRR